MPPPGSAHDRHSAIRDHLKTEVIDTLGRAFELLTRIGDHEAAQIYRSHQAHWEQGPTEGKTSRGARVLRLVPSADEPLRSA